MTTLEVIGQRALSTSQTLSATYGIAKMLIEEGVPGDFVECGVFAGSQVAAMAKAMLDTGDTPCMPLGPVLGQLGRLKSPCGTARESRRRLGLDGCIRVRRGGGAA